MSYWSDLLLFFRAHPETLESRERWTLAYAAASTTNSVSETCRPSFDPPAQTNAEFAVQYGLSVDYMMATKEASLRLPRDFIAQWRAGRGPQPEPAPESDQRVIERVETRTTE